MSVESIHEALQEAVHEVLETMFFVRQLEDGAGAETAESPDLAAQLDFEGNPGGRLVLTLAGAAARAVAADFLGAEEEELSSQQVEEVACELTNMICGSVLSRIESDTRFCLSSPHIVPAGVVRFPVDESAHSVGLERGALTAHLALWNRPDNKDPAASALTKIPAPVLTSQRACGLAGDLDSAWTRAPARRIG